MPHQEVLDWINAQRETYNIGAPLDALPLGRRGEACQCPVARAFRAGPLDATTSMYRTHLRECDLYGGKRIGTLEHPPAVRDFVDRFDAGFHPELDEASHS